MSVPAPATVCRLDAIVQDPASTPAPMSAEFQPLTTELTTATFENVAVARAAALWLVTTRPT
jgi:hypothetical protein